MTNDKEFTLQEALEQADAHAKRINLDLINHVLTQTDDEEESTEWSGAD